MTDQLKVCNCAGCRRELLGQSMKDLYDSLSEVQKQFLPPMTAGRVMGRPYCKSCLNEAYAKLYAFPRPVIHATEGRGSVATSCHFTCG